MPKTATPLTDTKIKTAKTKEKDYALSDGNGLQLLIKSTGIKVWQFVFTSPTLQKRRKKTFGNYPDLKLSSARSKRAEYLELIAEGTDPIDYYTELELKKSSTVKGQFHTVVYEWLKRLDISEGSYKKKKRAFERDIFPYFAKYNVKHELVSSIPIKDISHDKLLHALEEKAKSARETASRLLKDCRRVWQFAFERAYVDEIITAKIGQDALPKPVSKHYPKITDEKILKELLLSIENYRGQPITRLMLQFLTFIPLRAENLTTLKWEMVDLDKKILTIPRQEMKDKNVELPDFKLPLPEQVIYILKETQQLTGWGKWIFHGLQNITGPMNPETGNKALRIMGFTNESQGRKQTQHSFRGTFRSLAETYQSEHNATYEAKESVLDHHDSGKVAFAYLHQADYTEQMRPLLQWWADFLSKLKTKFEI